MTGNPAWLVVALFLMLLFVVALVFLLLRFSDPLSSTLKALLAILLAQVGGKALPNIQTEQPGMLSINFGSIFTYSNAKVNFVFQGTAQDPWHVEFIAVVLLILFVCALARTR